MACKFFGTLTNESSGDGLALNRLALARNGCGLQFYLYRVTELSFSFLVLCSFCFLCISVCTQVALTLLLRLSCIV